MLSKEKVGGETELGEASPMKVDSGQMDLATRFTDHGMIQKDSEHPWQRGRARPGQVNAGSLTGE